MRRERSGVFGSAAVLAYISFVRGGGPLRALLGVSGGSCDVCTGVYTLLQQHDGLYLTKMFHSKFHELSRFCETIKILLNDT